MNPGAICRAALGAALVVAAGCSYAPDFPSGTLACSSDGTCPEGYSCADGVTCWRQGECPNSNEPATKFVGHWDFVSPSTRTIICGAMTMPVENVTGDYVYLYAADPVPLRTNFFCQWDLDIAASGTSTSIRPGGTCSGPDPEDPTLIYTWRGESFTLSTADGRTGTLQMSIPYDYQRPTDSGSCTMTYTVTVTKDCS
jgi:hypothetical protein